ncbi:MAG: Fic family protein [Erysipelotrichaceae bacterium]|nr:Fic family protein [Erysipelotrichaceae bacterium]
MEKYSPPFVVTNEMLSSVAEIMELIGKIGALDDLSRFPVLRKQNRVRSIHSSCSIEANSLSLGQVKDIINGKAVIGPKKDIIEIQNAIKAYGELENIDPFSIRDLKRVHRIMGKDVIDGAGDFRTGNEGVSNENGDVVFIAPPPKLVDGLMTELFGWCKANFGRINPLILSSVFHYEFVFIHPFSDGNGRTVRLWQTCMLGKWRRVFYFLPIENYIKDNQEDYYKAISASHAAGNSNPFIVFMLRMIKSALRDLSQDASHLGVDSIYVKKLLTAMPDGAFVTATEILGLLGLKSKETLRKNYLDPAIKGGQIILEYPDKPTSKNQRYKKV